MSTNADASSSDMSELVRSDGMSFWKVWIRSLVEGEVTEVDMEVSESVIFRNPDLGSESGNLDKNEDGASVVMVHVKRMKWWLFLCWGDQ